MLRRSVQQENGCKTMAKRRVDPSEQAQAKQDQSAAAVGSGHAASRHTWRNIRLIIGREYKNQVTNRSFINSGIILAVLVAITAFIPTIAQYISMRTTTNTQTHIAVVNNAGMAEAALDSINAVLNGANPASPAPYAITTQPQDSLSSLQDQVSSGQLDILLVLDRAANGNLQLTYYSNASPTKDSNLSTVQSLAQLLTFLDTAQRMGLTPAQIQGLIAPPSLTVVRAQGQTARPTDELIAGAALAIVGPVLMVLMLTLYANSVAFGVAEEKTSRVMELLVNAATPFQLLIGKIVGIGAACLTQMACVVAVGIGALLLQTPLQAALFGTNGGGFIQYLTAISIPYYLFFLIYFLLDFFMYAALYAGLGAMVKRQEEVRSAVMVPSLLIALGYFVLYLGLGFPDSTVVKVLSYIPIFTPTLMLDRLALGTVAWWEVVLTIGLMLTTIFVCIWIAARLYRYGVLMYGQRPGLRQLLKIIRAK
jgi:ABC-2 type transport system permease protein